MTKEEKQRRGNILQNDMYSIHRFSTAREMLCPKVATGEDKGEH
jgi:hypothetical protein